jgi:hypothetical protein
MGKRMARRTGRTMGTAQRLAAISWRAQSEIRWTGELLLVDEDEVPEIQQQMRERYAQFR